MTFIQKIGYGISGGLALAMIGGGLQDGFLLLLGLGIYSGTIIWGLIKVS